MSNQFTINGILADTGQLTADHELLKLIEATAPYTGEDFFEHITLALASQFGVELAFVSELLVQADRARVVAACLHGRPYDKVEYNLAGTPCLETVAKGATSFMNSVETIFPNYESLVTFKAESYVGVLLKSGSDDAIGLLGIVDDGPVQDPEAFLNLLTRLAPRVAAELEHRQRGNALRRNETRFRLMVENSHDILFYYRLHPSQSFEYVSPAVEEVLGYPPEALLANPQVAIQAIHEDDRRHVMRALTTGSEEPVLARLIRPDGGLRWIEYRNFPFYDIDGKLVAVGGIMRDVTRREEAEEALRISEQYRRGLLEAMPDTIFRLDPNGVLLDFVPGEALEDFDLPAGEVIGRNIDEMLPSTFVANARRLIHSSLRSGRLQRMEFEFHTNDGDTKAYEARCLPFSSRGVLLILRDFTAIKWHEAEPERHRLRDELDTKIEERIRTNSYHLTYRELAVLHLVAEGAADKQIAEALGISIYTVNKHVGNILGKMNAASRTEAGVRAIREGLLG
jgi:PAS domain S-box-containing protein